MPAERGRLSEKYINENYADPDFEVAVHGLKHIHLGCASDSEVIFEIAEDRKNLEALFNKPARGMAYAFGSYRAENPDMNHRCSTSGDIPMSLTMTETGT